MSPEPSVSNNHQKEPSGSGDKTRFFVSFNGGTKDGAFIAYTQQPDQELVVGDETYRYVTETDDTLHYELVAS